MITINGLAMSGEIVRCRCVLMCAAGRVRMRRPDHADVAAGFVYLGMLYKHSNTPFHEATADTL